jgi:hypothetical protein
MERGYRSYSNGSRRRTYEIALRVETYRNQMVVEGESVSPYLLPLDYDISPLSILSHMFSFYYHWITMYLLSPYYLICSPSTTIGLRWISSLHTISYVLLLLPLDYEIFPSTTIGLRYISSLHTISYVLLLLPLDYDISPLSILSHMFSFYYHWITIYLHSPYYLICSPSTTIGLRNISFYYH